jgi:hypothetical protein
MRFPWTLLAERLLLLEERLRIASEAIGEHDQCLRGLESSDAVREARSAELANTTVDLINKLRMERVREAKVEKNGDSGDLAALARIRAARGL